MTSRTEALDLLKTANTLWTKARFNKGKMDFMALTPAGIHCYSNEGWVSQLKAMFEAADQASKAFARAVKGMAAEEIVSIVTEAA